MKRFLFILSGLFTITIAITIALRMTSDAMAVIVGIILGMLATVPTSLLLLYMLRQRENQQVDPRQQYQTGPYPPVVVVNSPPNGSYSGLGNANPNAFLPASAGERSFTIVGQEASPKDAANEGGGGFNRIFDELT